jgi:hypothetical protein
MINLSNYSCDKCDREFSRHCKHCYHTAEKPPTRFKPKKKTGVQTPEFRKPSAPPPSPTSGSNAVRPNPNYVPPASVKPKQENCTYSTPCGWCTKWDKKCDKKIECGNEKPQRGLRANANMYDDAMDPALKDIISGKGLSRLDTNLDPNKPLPSGIRKEIRG